MKASVEEITRLVIEALVRQGLSPADSAPQAAAATALKPAPTAAEPPAGAKPAGCGCGCKSKQSAAASDEPGTRRVTGRVVTQAELAGRLEGIRRLVIDRRAVVTPAASDWLREQGIVLVRGEATSGAKTAAANSAAANNKAKRRLSLAVWESRFDPQPLVGALVREGVAVSVVSLGSGAMVESIAAATELGPGVLLLTDQPHAAACQLNRDGRIRAAVAVSRQQGSAIVEELQPNVIVMRPSPAGLLDQKSLGKLLAESTGGSQGCGCHAK